MNNADKFAWKFLIDTGSVVEEWNYYGGCFDKHPNKTKKCLSLIKKVGIDWEKTKPTEDSMRSEFASTFDESAYVKVMLGTLYLKDGSKWEWGTSDVDPKCIINAIAEYLPDPFEDK